MQCEQCVDYLLKFCDKCVVVSCLKLVNACAIIACAAIKQIMAETK